MARAELERADRAVPEASKRYARFKQVKTGSAADLVRGWQFEVGETIARLEQKRARFALEQAQSKLKVLLEYEHGKNVRELRSAVEKARSDELARQASQDLEHAKLDETRSGCAIRQRAGHLSLRRAEAGSASASRGRFRSRKS